MLWILLSLSALHLAFTVTVTILLYRRLTAVEHHLKHLRKTLGKKEDQGPMGLLSSLMAGRTAAITGIKARYAQHAFIKKFISPKEGQILDPDSVDEFLGEDRTGEPYASRPDFNPRDALINLFETGIKRGLLRSDDPFYRELLSSE